MSHFTCPDCHALIEFVPTVKPRKRPTGPTSARKMRAVLEFMREVGPGQRPTAELFSLYCREVGLPHRQWPEMNKMAFVRALQANGAEPWRTETARGWDIPEIPTDQEPAKVAPSSREKILAEVYRQPQPVPMSVPTAPPAPRESAFDTIERMARERREREEANRRAAIRVLHDNPDYQ